MWSSLLIAGVTALAAAQSTFTPLRPPSLPLAVRSPYLSTWQQAGSDGGNGGILPGQWSTFWAGAVTGWLGYIRVDNITYTWMGMPAIPNQENYYVIQTGYEYTSTQSIFTLNVANQLEMTVTFLSPVLPDTLLEMSLPYSYMNVAIQSMDGKSHDVQLYTDISAEWVAGDRDATAEWSYGTTNQSNPPISWPPVSSPTSVAPGPLTTYATQTQVSQEGAPTHSIVNTHAPDQGTRPTGVSRPPSGAAKNSTSPPKINLRPGGVAYHKIWRQQQLEFAEFNQQAEWGYWYYATSNERDLTYQQGPDNNVRLQFINNGFLENSENDTFRAINDDYPVFGFAIDLGTVNGNGSQSDFSRKDHTFQISLQQKDCVYFEEASGNTSVPCLWTSYFSDDVTALEYFYQQFESLWESSKQLDDKVHSDSVAAAGSDYASLTSLAVRQAFGALEYTNSPSNPFVFLKEISSDGDIQTVDVIFPFHPITIYLNPDILRYILNPLFINQEAGYYPEAYALHHLGTFPNATGFNNPSTASGSDAEPQPLEESANMIIMTLAYAQRKNDNNYLSEQYSLLRQWTNYVVNVTLIPENQLSTDDFLGALSNDTNLAIKGIIAIEAMAQIANRTGHTEDGQNFTRIAHSYISQWQPLGIAYDADPPHTTASYHMNATYSLLYNLYNDALLGLDLVPKSVYEMQSAFYPTRFNTYGIPLRDSVTSTKADWQLWCAAIASESTQKLLISTVAKWLGETPCNFAFPDFYETITGNFAENMFNNRPVVGGMFSLLALQSAPDSPYVEPS